MNCWRLQVEHVHTQSAALQTQHTPVHVHAHTETHSRSSGLEGFVACSSTPCQGCLLLGMFSAGWWKGPKTGRGGARKTLWALQLGFARSIDYKAFIPPWCTFFFAKWNVLFGKELIGLLFFLFFFSTTRNVFFCKKKKVPVSLDGKK